MRRLIKVFTIFSQESMQNTVKLKIFTESPETRNGLNQMIRMDKSTGQKRVEVLFSQNVCSSDGKFPWFYSATIYCIALMDITDVLLTYFVMFE